MAEESIKTRRDFNGCISGILHLFDFGQAVNRKSLPHRSSVSDKIPTAKYVDSSGGVMKREGMDKGKKRVPNVVARLMGLDQLPDESNLSDDKPKAANRNPEKIKHAIALSKSRSVHTHSENNGEDRGDQMMQLRSHSFREHPQQKQLEEFKKDFAAIQVLHHPRYEAHSMDCSSSNMRSDNGTSMRMSAGRQRQNQSREFLDALEYLKKHEDIVFNAHTDRNAEPANRSLQAHAAQQSRKCYAVEPAPQNNAKVRGNCDKTTLPQQFRSISPSKNPTKTVALPLANNVVVLKSSCGTKTRTKENINGYSNQYRSREIIQDKKGLNTEKCKCKLTSNLLNQVESVSAVSSERKIIAKPASGSISKSPNCPQYLVPMSGKKAAITRREEKRLLTNKVAENQGTKILSGTQIVARYRRDTDNKGRSASLCSSRDCSPHKKNYSQKMPKERGHGEEKSRVPNRGKSNGTPSNRKHSAPQTSEVFHITDKRGCDLPEDDTMGYIDQKTEFPSPNSVLDGPSLDSLSPISFKEINADIAGYCGKLRSLKLDEDDDRRDSDQVHVDLAIGNIRKSLADPGLISSRQDVLLDISLDLQNDPKFERLKKMVRMEDKETNFVYIRSVLLCAGFSNDSILVFTKWFSPSNPINPLVFNQLEEYFCEGHESNKAITELSDESQSVRHRKFLFDLVNEILCKKLHQYKESQTWLNHSRRKLRYMPTGGQLIQEIWDEICNLPTADCEVFQDVETLITKDMKDETLWAESNQDIGRIGTKLESLLFNTLLDEVILDMIFA